MVCLKKRQISTENLRHLRDLTHSKAQDRTF
jgi:hypothetical protein